MNVDLLVFSKDKLRASGLLCHHNNNIERIHHNEWCVRPVGLITGGGNNP